MTRSPARALREPLDPLPLPSLPDIPLVTMVVTGFNQESMIAETLQSVIAQTYPAIEVVVVDGGGQDQMLEVARGILAGTARPHTLVRQPANLGMMRDRQRGLELAKGDLVCFLDGDDLAFPDRIERQVRQIQQHGLDAAYGHLVRIYDQVGRVIASPPPVQPPETWNPDLFVEKLVYHNGPMAQGGLFKTALLRGIGGIDQGFPMNDWPFMIEAARRGGRMLVSAEPVWYYREHAAGHHVAMRPESLQWQLDVARHYCTPSVARTSAARSYRIAANAALHEGKPGRALAWFARASLHRRQRRTASFLMQAAGKALSHRSTRRGR